MFRKLSLGVPLFALLGSACNLSLPDLTKVEDDGGGSGEDGGGSDGGGDGSDGGGDGSDGGGDGSDGGGDGSDGGGDGSDGGGAADCNLTIGNDSGYVFYYINVYDAEYNFDGWDLLDSGEALYDGDSVSVMVPPNGGSYYSIIGEDEDEDTYLVIDFDWCMDGEDLSYTLTLADLL